MKKAFLLLLVALIFSTQTIAVELTAPGGGGGPGSDTTAIHIDTADEFTAAAAVSPNSLDKFLLELDSTGAKKYAFIKDLPTGTGMASFDVAGDGGTPQTITNGNTLDIAGGTNITTSAGATDTLTINLDDAVSLAGDFTVDTTDFFVDTGANRVGIGTTTGNTTLQIGNGFGVFNMEVDANSNGNGYFLSRQNSVRGQWVLSTATDDTIFQMYDGSGIINSFHTGADSYINGGSLGINTATPERLFSVVGDVQVTGNIYFTGNVAEGAWQGTAVADTYVANDLTISGGTVNNTPIGASTASTGKFTNVEATQQIWAASTDNSPTTKNITIDFNTGEVHSYDLESVGADIDITLSNITTANSYVISFQQGSTERQFSTITPSIIWQNRVTPSITSTANFNTDVVIIKYPNGEIHGNASNY